MFLKDGEAEEERGRKGPPTCVADSKAYDMALGGPEYAIDRSISLDEIVVAVRTGLPIVRIGPGPKNGTAIYLGGIGFLAITCWQ